jgi:hypothetical protein
MKAELKFDLENIDDEMALKRAIKSKDLCLAIFDIQSKLYRTMESKNDFAPDSAESDAYNRCLDLIFEEVNDILNYHDINTDELIN